MFPGTGATTAHKDPSRSPSLGELRRGNVWLTWGEAPWGELAPFHSTPQTGRRGGEELGTLLGHPCWHPWARGAGGAAVVALPVLPEAAQRHVLSCLARVPSRTTPDGPTPRQWARPTLLPETAPALGARSSQDQSTPAWRKPHLLEALLGWAGQHWPSRRAAEQQFSAWLPGTRQHRDERTVKPHTHLAPLPTLLSAGSSTRAGLDDNSMWFSKNNPNPNCLLKTRAADFFPYNYLLNSGQDQRQETPKLLWILGGRKDLCWVQLQTILFQVLVIWAIKKCWDAQVCISFCH